MIGSNRTAGKAERGSSSGHVGSKVALLMEHQLDKQEIELRQFGLETRGRVGREWQWAESSQFTEAGR